jgi:K+/H+ antiporter YhaU regulatory subunit KhtT
MAKIKKDNTLKQEQLATDIEIGRLNAQAKEYDKLLSLKKKGKAYDVDRLKHLETEHRSTDSLLKKINKLVDKYNELGDSIKETNDDIDLTISNFDEMDSSLISIGNLIGKNSKLYTIQSERINKAKGVLASIAEVTKSNIDLSQKDIDAVKAYSVAYQSNMVSIAEANALKQRGEINSEKEVELIKQATKSYKEATASIELSESAVEAVGEVLEKMNSEVNKYGVFAEKAASNTQSLDTLFDQFQGIPAMRELNTLIKTNTKDTLAFKAAMFAVGAAIGKAAFDYFGAPIKAAMQQQREVEQIGIDGISERAKLQSDANFIDRDAAKGYSKIQEESDNNRIETARNVASAMNDANFAAERAANSFAASMKQGAVQFEAASKTALFGKGIGSVSYGAAQMQLAGIGADKVASAMSAAAGATGKMPTSKIASDMAVLSERTGQSVESVADINEMFQRMDGASEKTALNLQEGLRTMAQQSGLDLGKLMSEVAEASKDALSYQIKGGKALAKQVGFAQSMGVNFGDVAKAGKNMVLNYKDSIKAEMQLSSLLGEQVDLSEVRAKFASGDQAGALKALQAQGLNPEDMDMFQQEALSEALGGLDLNSLQKIAQNKGADVGNLKAGNVQTGNQQFLATTQQAQATLESKQAMISAREAILDAQLSGKIADAFINSDGNKNYLKAQNEQAGKTSLLNQEIDALYKSSKAYNEYLTKSSQLDFVSGLKESLVSGLAPLIGGALMTGLTGGFKGVGGKIAGIFGKGKGGSVDATAATTMVTPTASAGTGGGIVSSLKDAAVGTVTGGEGGIGSVIKDTAVGAVAGKADELIPGAGGVVEGLAGQVEAVEEPLEKAMSLGEKLKDFGKGVGSFLKSIGTGIGNAIKGIMMGLGQGIISLGTALSFPTPLGPAGIAVAAFFIALAGALWLAEPAFTALAPVMIKIAEVVGTLLVEALRQAGPIITSIFNGIGTVISSIGNSIATVITSIATSIGMLSNVSSANLAAVAFSTGLMATALAAFGVGSFVSGVGKFFGGSVFDDLKDISNFANPLMATALAVDALANAFSRLGSINVSALSKIPWGDMEDFASEGGKFVIASGGGGSLAVSKDTADNIKKMATNTEAMVKLNNTLVKLTKEGFFGGEASRMSLYIDGKAVNTSLKRYKDNTKAGNPNND